MTRFGATAIGGMSERPVATVVTTTKRRRMRRSPSGDNYSVVAESGDDLNSTAESFDVAANRSDLGVVKVAALDARDARLRDPQLLGHVDLVESVSFTDLG
jgi:hypothetical protein